MCCAVHRCVTTTTVARAGNGAPFDRSKNNQADVTHHLDVSVAAFVELLGAAGAAVGYNMGSGPPGSFGRRNTMTLRWGTTPGWMRGASMIVAITVVASACGGSGHKPSTSTTTATGATRATGPPLVLGMAVQENSPLGSMAEMRLAAQAAAEYVNAELGGIQGRPLKLLTCVTSATPESNISCAHQLVDQAPVAVLGGGDLLGAAAVKVYEQAGLPIIGGAAFSDPELAYGRAVRFQGFPLAALPAFAVYAADNLHAKKVAIVYQDSPVARAAVPKYIEHVLVRKGLKASDISIDPGTPDTADWTPVLSAAAGTHPDVIIALTGGNTCIPILLAHAAVAPSTKLLVQDNCLDPRRLSQEGNAADGVTAIGLFVSPTTNADPEVKTFLAKLKQYGGNQIPIDSLTQEGFSEVMNLWDVLHRAPPSALTTAGILGPFKDGAVHHDFMGHSYVCNGSAVPAFPAVCDAHARVFVVQHGNVTDDPSWINGADLIG